MDELRGIRYDREPSDAVLRYREYQSLLAMLSDADRYREAPWRLHPKLSSYPTAEAARTAILEDWVTYGFKREVDQALDEFSRATQLTRWADWSRAQSLFQTNRVLVNQDDVWVQTTLLVPAPSDWFSMASWVQMRTPTSASGVSVTYQIARIGVVRPWLALDMLLSNRLRSDARGSAVLHLSDGTSPQFDSYPTGAMASFIEELLLVRNIHFVNPDGNPVPPPAQDAMHPLVIIANPNEVTLLGYVLRTLPLLSR